MARARSLTEFQSACPDEASLQRSACVKMARAVPKPRAKITMRRPGRH